MDLVSARPFWPQSNRASGIYPSLHEDVYCDVLILGAGITGAFLAERLSREGHDVVVLDKRSVGQGSTSASTALLQYELDLPLTALRQRIGREEADRVYRLGYAAIDSIDLLVKRLRADCDFERVPSVYLASGDDATAGLEAECVARHSAGCEVQYLAAQDITDRFSFRRPGALLSPQAAQFDPYRFTYALLAQAAAQGARIFERSAVAAIDPGRDRVRLVSERGCVILAKHVLFATGYEGQSYLPQPVATLKSTYAVASEPLTHFPGWWARALIWETARPYLYLRTTGDGRALIGGEDDDFRDPRLRDASVAAKSETLSTRFGELFPHIPFQRACQWAGTFGETKDSLPYIGTVRQMPRCSFVLCFGGNGIVLSASACEFIGDVIAGRSNADAELFRFDR